MKTTRGIGVLMVAMCWLGVGAAAGSDAKPNGDAHGGAAHATGEVKVNINDASKTELMKLEGIGASVAQKIIAYREAHGPFKRAHDLVRVDGIGKDVFEKNSSRISVK